METRDQKYAKAAFPKVSAQKNTAIEKGYRTLALNFPVMVLQSGLAQAVGFLMAKANSQNEYAVYLNDLASILLNKDAKALHDDIINSPLANYQHLTRQTLEASAWLKRYSQSLLTKKSETESAE
ncbi:MAG TPA: type III-B CRISPR module-associated protein Cmr5 [Agitococcus sp.]|nr:type III-B CRISPR module-associated protein Cmr5 [Agitococcus sp.]